jgi:hypothetical protein
MQPHDTSFPGPKGPGQGEFARPAPRRSVIEQPLHSLDATDWRAYADQLRASGLDDQGRRAARIAESLARDVNLVLVNFCPAESLASAEHGNHWLRVGQTWFIGAPGTFIETNRVVWWRLAWVRAGFKRYPSTDADRVENDLIKLNYGTPLQLPHPRFDQLVEKQTAAALLAAFFDAHALAEIPSEYL